VWPLMGEGREGGGGEMVCREGGAVSKHVDSHRRSHRRCCFISSSPLVDLTYVKEHMNSRDWRV
jgi:hypothetical protein